MIELDNGKDRQICLVDSNIWLYAFIETQDAGKSAVAKSLIRNRDIDKIRELIGSFPWLPDYVS